MYYWGYVKWYESTCFSVSVPRKGQWAQSTRCAEEVRFKDARAGKRRFQPLQCGRGKKRFVCTGADAVIERNVVVDRTLSTGKLEGLGGSHERSWKALGESLREVNNEENSFRK
eukprot:756539-Hanusia_phi.AAC.3